MSAVTCEAPAAFPENFDRPSVFLAGSIDQGAATDWQSRLIDALADADLLVFNPRRGDWDASWDTSPSNPMFREQVEWELAAQERADLIAFYFEPGSRAPVTMLELGLAANTGRCLVCCPNLFWRSGNVDLVCERYGIEQVDSLDSLGAAIVEQLGVESKDR